MGHAIKHFITITKHRHKVMRYCFSLGLYAQGLKHDLSKYSFSEFIPGAKFYQGTSSPIAMERKVKGYSLAWLHHKGRNKHHFEYWMHYSQSQQRVIYIKMPIKYVKESICDRIAATEVYYKKNYNDSLPLEYFLTKNEGQGMHKETAAKMQQWLTLVKDLGRKKAFKIIKKEKDY